MKIAFVIRSLDAGGAERQLVCLSRGLVGRGHDVSILTFHPDGVLEKDLAGTGVDLIGLDKSGRWDIVRFLARLMKRMRAVEPDVIHGYKPVESALGLLVARQLRVPFVWGVRASSLPIELYDRVSRIQIPNPRAGTGRRTSDAGAMRRALLVRSAIASSLPFDVVDEHSRPVSATMGAARRCIAARPGRSADTR